MKHKQLTMRDKKNSSGMPTKVRIKKYGASGHIIITQQQPTKDSQEVITLKRFCEYEKAEDWFDRFAEMLAE